MNAPVHQNQNPFAVSAPQTQAMSTVQSDSQRAIAEVQAALVIAKQFPRNPIEAYDRVMNACQRPGLAQSAVYSYARGGSSISGPSIRLAEMLAQNWGNIQYGIRELSSDNGESTVEAFAWDVETNTRQTLEGDRDDAHRAAHDRCYLTVADGVVIHYATEKGDDGLKYPVILSGFPIVDSIMLNVLELSRNVREPGEYKTVNSGAPVLVSNIIKSILKERGVRKRSRISLKEGKFERLAIDGDVVLPEDCIALLD